MRRVQVTNGVRTGPFRIRRLLSCLRLSCDHTATTSRKTFGIWLVGDSTMTQLFWGFFCALNRIGGVVHHCIQEGPHAVHYDHPACDKKQTLVKETGLSAMASVKVGQTLYVLKCLNEHVIHTPELLSRALGGCSSSTSGGHQDCPDLVLANAGLHINLGSYFAHAVRKWLTALFDLPEPILSRTVWRETTVQHFHADDGLWEHRHLGKADEDSRMAPTCKLSVNISDPPTLTRQHQAHSIMLEVARERGVHPLPYVSMDAIEANSGHLFPPSNNFNKQENATDLDCTHRVYTPLYYDAVFNAIADTLCGYI